MKYINFLAKLLNDQEEEGIQRGKVNKDTGVEQEDLLQDMLSPNSSCGSSLDGAGSPDSFTEEHETLDPKHTSIHNSLIPIESNAQRWWTYKEAQASPWTPGLWKVLCMPLPSQSSQTRNGDFLFSFEQRINHSWNESSASLLPRGFWWTTGLKGCLLIICVVFERANAEGKKHVGSSISGNCGRFTNDRTAELSLWRIPGSLPLLPISCRNPSIFHAMWQRKPFKIIHGSSAHSKEIYATCLCRKFLLKCLDFL